MHDFSESITWRRAVLVSGILLLLALGNAAKAQTVDRICPDGGRSYFGVCPNDKPAANVLQRQLEELANFPKNLSLKTPPDILEGHLTQQEPQLLFDIVSSYDRESLISVPLVGSQLSQFKVHFYSFRQNEIELEKKALDDIGSDASEHYPDAWRMYLNYSVLRALGYSGTAIHNAGEVLMLGYNWQEAERIFTQVSSSGSFIKSVKSQVESYEALTSEAKQIAESFRGRD